VLILQLPEATLEGLVYHLERNLVWVQWGKEASPRFLREKRGE